MARFVHIDYPLQHGGVNRVARGFETLAGFSATQAVLHTLALIGSPVTRGATRVGTLLATWKEARRQREQDRKLWNLALNDARIMADLSRAMSEEALQDARKL
jgi:hypothetical protein